MPTAVRRGGGMQLMSASTLDALIHQFIIISMRMCVTHAYEYVQCEYVRYMQIRAVGGWTIKVVVDGWAASNVTGGSSSPA